MNITLSLTKEEAAVVEMALAKRADDIMFAPDDKIKVIEGLSIKEN